ncbi:inositol-1-monophosphatase [Lachnospiraceae bacterium]|nr:inositol-1-monophosphatase [Lachnospiraceae bacterium]
MNNEKQKKLLSEITNVVRDCGEIILHADRDKSCIDEKAGHANFVTTYDKKVQQELQKRLLEILPEAVFVGEEEEIHASIAKGYAFIVDPIDGTTNFIKDYHMSAISVGLTLDGERYMGVVYNPYLNEMFTAIKGQGAFLNGIPIHVSSESIENGLVLFGTAPYYEELNKKSFEMAYEYFKRSIDVRRSGSAALDLCNVAAGRAELFFELRLCPWDLAAGSLIVEEAGGKVTTAEGGQITLYEPCSLIATNGIVTNSEY